MKVKVNANNLINRMLDTEARASVAEDRINTIRRVLDQIVLDEAAVFEKKMRKGEPIESWDTPDNPRLRDITFDRLAEIVNYRQSNEAKTAMGQCRAHYHKLIAETKEKTAKKADAV